MAAAAQEVLLVGAAVDAVEGLLLRDARNPRHSKRKVRLSNAVLGCPATFAEIIAGSAVCWHTRP